MESLEITTFQAPEAPALHLEIAEKKSATPKEDLVIEWLKAHPEDMSMSNRNLADKLGVTHPTVGKAKKIVKGE